MLRGLRTADAPLLQRLCAGDTRLYLRLGALLQAQLAFTEAALQSTIESPAGKHLLNDRRLKDVATQGFDALVAEHSCAAMGLILTEGEGEGEGKVEGKESWRVIALDDELNNPLNVTESVTAMVEVMPDTQALGELVATLTPSLRGPVEGLLQARADDQRAAALEQLRYAAPPLSVVCELMPMLLADAAELVRERAIGLLMASGASITVIDLVRALHRRDDHALGRLGETIASLPAMQLDLVVAALMATATRGQTTQAVMVLCQRLAQHLAQHRALDRLIELLLPTRLSLLTWVRALQEYDTARVEEILRSHLGRGLEQDATILILLAVPGHAGDAALVDLGVDLLLQRGEDPKERMALAAALRRLDHSKRLGALINARGLAIGEAHDTSVHWLIAELCRDRAIDSETAESLAHILRKLLRDAPGPHLVAILEQQLPALLPASDAARGALVEPLVEVIARFRDERTMDLVSACLSGIGTAATAAMWNLLEDHPHDNVRLLAADLLPHLIVSGERTHGPAAVTRLLRGLERAQQARERGALVTAAARLTRQLDLDSATCERIDSATVGLGEWAIEAIGHLTAAQHCPPARRDSLLDQLLDLLTEELPDRPVEQVRDPATDDVTFVLDASLGAHTQNIPKVLAALYLAGSTTYLPAESLARMVGRMCEQWRAVSSWQTIWGPGNIQDLGRVLGLMAGRLDFPGPLRVRICEALLPKLNQLTIARVLTRVFVAGDGPYLSGLAGKAAERLVQLASDKYYAEDEWPELVETLVDFLVIPHLGPQAESTRRRLVNLLQAYRAQCSSRARAKLRALLPDLSSDLRDRLDWV
ncbi:MAG: hypothetical protein H0W78_19480 [Planctomycetes bacterium]|nr:hypothetical protein [Planctomycetota bacterium]